ncbi:DUF7716 domain-containing protein [Gynuella sunshinyii]|uniref:DUF7716 domain-containing protein n=1 Tax=Gynuella sunshinyii YC6258 TaxID=1445510 RepID=A0A0C5UYE1_9GAMM|nr:hypothetical protein [Gynuella sunshinyii]AJQ92285.1 hypothetical Protein YC6258_00233 [Gynuella sunshinyii YC6258]
MKALEDILAVLAELPEDEALYIVKNDQGFDFKNCAVLDPDEAEDPDGSKHDYVINNRLVYFLEISILLQIEHNLRMQNEEYSADDLVQAVLFYFKHDAFITV